MTVVYLLGLVIGFYSDNKHHPNVSVSSLDLWTINMGFFRAWPIFVFGFTCHQNVCFVFGSQNINKAMKREAGIYFFK